MPEDLERPQILVLDEDGNEVAHKEVMIIEDETGIFLITIILSCK